MKLLSNFRKALAAVILLCAAIFVPASGLISDEASNVIRMQSPRTAGARGKQLATLRSYLLTDKVTVGLDPDEPSSWGTSSIARGIQVWADALADSPFVLAAPGEKPMVVVRFVDSIDGTGDIQGQVEATRMLHWGSSVGYKIEGVLQVCRSTGRRDLREDELTEVVAHELGHLIGLADVNECVGLMGPFVPGRPRLRPSREELDAVLGYRDQLRAAIARLNP